MAKSKNESLVPKMTARADDTVSPSAGRSTTRSSRGRDSRYRYTSLAQRYPYVHELAEPFSRSDGFISIRDMIDMVEKAYFGFALARNVVETLVELSNTDTYLKGGNKQSREFINMWMRRVGMNQVADQWFRDYFWKANVYPYRFDADLSSEDLKQLRTVYGEDKKELSTAARSTSIPIDYVMLNPADIAVEDQINYYGDTLFKLLSPRELDRINNPKTDEDKEFRKSFSSKELASIKNGTLLYSKLDAKKLYYSSYKRQRYYAFGVPFLFSVLSDINFKLLLKKLDEEVAKTFDLAILHFRVGDEKTGVANKATQDALIALFQQPKLQRVLVTDYTVQGEWLIPPIHEILGKEKYEQVDSDLSKGLFSAIFGEGDKFASLSVKVKVLVEKLQEARKAFINEFLQPEIKRVSELLNFKTFPTVHFVDIDLEDQTTLRRIFGRLAEIGFLTPLDVSDAIDKGILPEEDRMIENQRKFKDWKDEGLFESVLNKQNDAVAATGRPAGSKSPQSTKKQKPMSLSGLINTTAHFIELKKQIQKNLKANATDEVLNRVAVNIISKETENKWVASAAEYAKQPDAINEKAMREIQTLKKRYSLDDETSAIVLWLGDKIK
jgi:hypothetical protein